jgi:DNA topoisomerase II
MSRWLRHRQSRAHGFCKSHPFSTLGFDDEEDGTSTEGDDEEGDEGVLEADESAFYDQSSSVMSREKSVEDQYSRKTPLEHVLLRPGMYIGPTERLPPSPVWVLEGNDPGSELRMVRRDFGLVPALIKVFDEILVNASDNRLRNPKTCTQIDVTIHRGSKKEGDGARIRIWNNGKGIPVHMHNTEKLYVPELLFGHLLTGSNFDDNEKRLTGGRHGYGAKLANIFSKRFTVETLDSKRRLHYAQTWTNNMHDVQAAIVTPTDEVADYTCIEFEPDLQRLGCKSNQLPDEEYAVMRRRVIDLAGCFPTLKVTLDGRDVSMNSFADYCQLYRTSETKLFFKNVNSRWTVGVGLSEAGSFETVSFVNGMATSRGGTHINMLLGQIMKVIQTKVEKADKELGQLIGPALIRRHLFLACNAQIENPTFDSQMKENLTSSPSTFGSVCKLSSAFLKSLTVPIEEGGPGIVEELVLAAKGRKQASLFKEVGGKKTKRQLMSIPKLEDAHLAGTDSSLDCTLILTEGDSAKALAVAGLEVVGRNRFGVFPLRGKFLNVRDATTAQLTNNEEVKALTAILGLNFKTKYDCDEQRRQLRYGRILLMTDQDNDGSHIKGLIMNFFRHFWPSILKPTEDSSAGLPFLACFVTPLLKATKKTSKGKVLAFYSAAEYKAWRDTLDEAELRRWSVKFYKGLGTSTPAEAKEYFSAFDKNLVPYRWKSDHDGELLDMVFDKSRAADRRDWITNEYDENASLELDPNGGNEASYEDFVNKEMIHFSNADNIRRFEASGCTLSFPISHMSLVPSAITASRP